MTDHDHDHDHDKGLNHDLTRLADFAARRRALLKWGLGVSALPLLACAGSNLDSTDMTSEAGAGTTGTGTDTGTDDTCSTIPEETEGPYPGDGTNGANALALAGIVRSDIRQSVAGASGTAVGIPLTVTLTLQDANNGCKPIAGYAIYIWHCDRDGNYSMYSAAAASENYLRGVQETAEDGTVTFTTIFPACYTGRWPHIHFEVYPSLEMASSGANKIATSQLAFPESTCEEAYATDGYASSIATLSQVSLSSDMVFSDSVSQQLASMSGSADSGFVAKLNVTI
jgi:protocatechuate 3,4-dioxygenase beta subunit